MLAKVVHSNIGFSKEVEFGGLNKKLERTSVYGVIFSYDPV